jgi:protein SCO1/2
MKCFAGLRRIGITALLASLLITACNRTPPPYRATAVDKVTWGKDFSLTAQNGSPLNTADLRGKALIVFFGYTHYPDICAPTLAKLALLSKALGDDAKRVQVLFVSVDPEHDNPAQLKRFLSGFDPGFIGLTGSPEALGAIAADHMVYFRRAKRGSRIEHTGMLFLKGTRGQMRLLMKESAPLDDMVHDLRLLLKE